MKNKIINFFLYLTPNMFKPRIKGTWSEIVKKVNEYSPDPRMYNTNGYLIRFIGVKERFYPYIWTLDNIGELTIRKTNKCFYAEHWNSGQIDLADEWNLLFELLEIPEDTSWKIDVNKIRIKYRLDKAKKSQHEYY